MFVARSRSGGLRIFRVGRRSGLLEPLGLLKIFRFLANFGNCGFSNRCGGFDWGGGFHIYILRSGADLDSLEREKMKESVVVRRWAGDVAQGVVERKERRHGDKAALLMLPCRSSPDSWMEVARG